MENGGIGIAGIFAFIQSLKLSWIRNLFTKDTKWKTILVTLCPEVNDLKYYGSKKCLCSRCNSFWKDVFKAYDKLSTQIDLGNNEEIAAEPIFYDDKFQINRTYFCFKSWSRKNIFKWGTSWMKMANF